MMEIGENMLSLKGQSLELGVSQATIKDLMKSIGKI
jgi:hypothetical protein